FAKARALGVVTIGLAGGDGGRMAQPGELDHCLVVESGSIHRIQETHVAIYHVLWDLVHTLLADDRGGLATGGAAGSPSANPAARRGRGAWRRASARSCAASRARAGARCR